jgi:hypothetical protein
MPGLQDIPDDQPISSFFPGQATPATAIEQVLFRAPFRCVITGVEFTPNTVQAGANTNSFTLNIRNRAAGTGTAIPATLAFVAGVDLAATTPRAIPVSATPATLLLQTGDVVTAEKAIVGTGLACPAGAITVHLRAA